MAELDSMIGLAAVKEQVRSIAASIEAARRRALAGYQTEKPMRHFVFLGPPGTGKTAVARVLAKIFYAFGLLETPELVEAHRADLIGEYLGATAIKTNELVDSALGGVLFIDEAYGLVNEGDGQTDRFGKRRSRRCSSAPRTTGRTWSSSWPATTSRWRTSWPPTRAWPPGSPPG